VGTDSHGDAKKRLNIIPRYGNCELSGKDLCKKIVQIAAKLKK